MASSSTLKPVALPLSFEALVPAFPTRDKCAPCFGFALRQKKSPNPGAAILTLEGKGKRVLTRKLLTAL
jgi:hypothetical protein